MAANCTPTAEIPNPCTSLAFLAPESAMQLEVSRYLYWATVGAFLWDWTISLPDEIRIFRKTGIRLPVIAYVLSRFGTLAYIIIATVFQALPVHGSCQTILWIIGFSYPFAAPATAALFFFRVRAVYDRSIIVTLIFGTLWLGTLGAAIALPFTLKGDHIGTTDYCIQTSVAPGASAVVIINACSDTLVFLFISWRLALNNFTAESWGTRVRSFYKGDGLPRLSKTLLQSGQAYYLATVGLNVATMIMILVPTAPPVYHAFLSLPNIALENSMACRVFRSIHLGTISSQPGTSYSSGRAPSGIRFVDRPPHAIRPQLYSDIHSTPLDISVTTQHSSLDDTNQKKNSYIIEQETTDVV
ncbi:uncharacterized protein EDB93DRAFT_1107416 [Suillus bovinus]|uniref:uncharacterized protein n=1 Tax=Suillus bovinus TaxID=48563 RepID=UPI001B85FB78|nr:uncharacterized protein EDB93DRAFT_1107416 [Suillus bovinus]KAG2134037.1 hypothetical protein EDB93DRAFT_1107416 [Suillus bovinus]